jgi:hydroxypyruvate isomerase
MMFQEYDFLDRFMAAAGVGFSGVEILFSYAFKADEVTALFDRKSLSYV